MTSLIKNIDETLCFNEKTVRVYGTFEEPLFVVKDICDILGLKNTTKTVEHIDEEYSHLIEVNTSSGIQSSIVVSESGLYQIIMKCRKKIAKPFQKWVCGEVLPSLRKKGEYKMNEEYQLKLKEIEEEKLKLEEELEEKDEEIEKKSNRIKLLEKKTCKKLSRTETGKNVVYIITNEYLSQERIFIVGRAVDLANRLSSYNKGVEHEVVYQRECNNAKQMALIEETILYKLDSYRECANRDKFILPEDSDISLFTNIINQVCDCFNDVGKDVEIEKYDDDRDEIYYEDNKEYIKEYKKQHYLENKDEIDKKNKAWGEEHFEERQVYMKTYLEENKEEIKEQRATYRKENKEKIKEQNARYYSENKEEINNKNKLYHEENRDKIMDQRKEYYQKNIEEIRAKDRARNPKVMCECGLSICKKSMSQHTKSKTHQTFMIKKLEEETNIESESI
jgi:prophage antirepressor-like protein